MAKGDRVPRPAKASEYRLVFATREAAVGWRDVCATQRSTAADAWDYLTQTPEASTPTAHPLRGDLGIVTRGGVSHVRWQYELNGGARIWYFVVEQTVYFERVYSKHPNQTK